MKCVCCVCVCVLTSRIEFNTSLFRGDSSSRRCRRIRLRALWTMLDTESLWMGTAVGSVSLDNACVMSLFSTHTHIHKDVMDWSTLEWLMTNSTCAFHSHPQTFHLLLHGVPPQNLLCGFLSTTQFEELREEITWWTSSHHITCLSLYCQDYLYVRRILPSKHWGLSAFRTLTDQWGAWRGSKSLPETTCDENQLRFFKLTLY